MRTAALSHIKPEALSLLRQSNSQLIVIDVRTAGEFESVHATGAKLEPLQDLDPKSFISSLESPEQPVYILCKSGIRATQAAEQLLAAGLSSAVVVEGGTDAWLAANLPVERASRSVMPLDRQMRSFAGLGILIGSLLAMTVDPHFIWIPLFMGCGLLFSGLTGLCPMMNALARMPWNGARN